MSEPSIWKEERNASRTPITEEEEVVAKEYLERLRCPALLERQEGDFRRQQRKKVENPTVTLANFMTALMIRKGTPDFHLFQVFAAIKTAVKIVASALRKKGFAQMFMLGTEQAARWHEIRNNDCSFNELFTELLEMCGGCCLIASKADEDTKRNPKGTYIVTVNAINSTRSAESEPVYGSTFAVYRREGTSTVLLDREVFQEARKAVAAIYSLYGCSTQFICAFASLKGIHRFFLDPILGEFVLRQDECFMPKDGLSLSTNEAEINKWESVMARWLMKKKNVLRNADEYYSRHTGCYIADIHRIIQTGGLYVSPRDKENPGGTLNLMFDVHPLAFICSKAGGMVSDGVKDLTDLRPQSVTQTTPVFLGSVNEVERICHFIKKVSWRRSFDVHVDNVSISSAETPSSQSEVEIPEKEDSDI